MAWLLARLAEPSSHAGIGMILMGLSMILPEPYQGVAVAIGTALGGSAFVKRG
jgi:hypothetical protein